MSSKGWGMRFSSAQLQSQSDIRHEMGSQLLSLLLIVTARYTLASRIQKTHSHNELPFSNLLMTVKISEGNCV